jgi:hypothetical protein
VCAQFINFILLIDAIYSVFLFGGYDGQNCFNDVHALNTVTMAWSKIMLYGTTPETLMAHSSLVHPREPSKVIVFGGRLKFSLFLH